MSRSFGMKLKLADAYKVAKLKPRHYSVSNILTRCRSSLVPSRARAIAQTLSGDNA